MVTVTKIDPKDIPEVSNKFLMRGNKVGSSGGEQTDGIDKSSRPKGEKRRDRDEPFRGETRK